jgi:hypothetical protein
MKYAIYVLSVLTISSSGFANVMPPKPEVESGKNHEYSLVSPNAEETVSFLVSESRMHRGIVTFYSGGKVEFRVPAAESAALVAAIRSTGYITDETISVSDVGEQIAVLRSQIQVKRDYLTKLYKLTEESDLGGTLTAEKEIESAINEIDRLKSRIKTMERQGRYSSFSVTVSGPAVNGGENPASIWAFINNLGIDTLIRGK